MKIQTILTTLYLLVFLFGNNKYCFSQFQTSSTPIYTPPSTIDYNLLQNALAKRQAEYDNNQAYIDNLIDWIYQLKSQLRRKLIIIITG